MEEIKLEAQIRGDIGKKALKNVRHEDRVPGVVYGGKKKPVNIKVDRRAYEKIMRQHKGESVVFHVNIMDDGKKVADTPAIVKEEQHDPGTDSILHIDFQRISLKEEIEVKVPISSKGEPVGVKKGGGSLDHVLWELDIVCLPTAIPQHIDVDVSALEIGESIHLKDIMLPAGVKTKHDPEAILFTVVPPMEEEVAEAEPEEGAEGEPEVIGKKEKEEEPSEEKAEEKPAPTEEKA